MKYLKDIVKNIKKEKINIDVFMEDVNIRETIKQLIDDGVERSSGKRGFEHGFNKLFERENSKRPPKVIDSDMCQPAPPRGGGGHRVYSVTEQALGYRGEYLTMWPFGLPSRWVPSTRAQRIIREYIISGGGLGPPVPLYLRLPIRSLFPIYLHLVWWNLKQSRRCSRAQIARGRLRRRSALECTDARHIRPSPTRKLTCPGLRRDGGMRRPVLWPERRHWQSAVGSTLLINTW